MTTHAENKILEKRVLVLMPTGRDAALVCATLEKSDIATFCCNDAAELEEKISGGGGAVLLAEEALQNGTLERLIDSINRHPVWSDVPVVIFAANAHNSEKMSAIVGARLNATIVERPIRIPMLVSAVRGALRARDKQYQTRDLLNQLEESDKQKDLFLATLSHELRTPLNSMLGWIKLLREKSDGEINFEHGLEVIERNARTQSKLISDILFVSRVITGKLEIQLENVDLSFIVQTALDSVLPAIEAKNIRLQISIDKSLEPITGDADRLQQVLLNLLSNAIKFTPPDGQISVSVKGNDSNIHIEIADSGQGIKPEFLPFVFERFRQADNSYTREVGGLGLGLAIVRYLVELHGGTVAVKSEGENRGAVFTVKFPATAQKSETPESSDQSSETSSKSSDQVLEGVRVLLVEDDADSREMLTVMFDQYAMKTIAVDSAAAALDAVQNIQADILISDVGLPGEDGYTLIRKIRQLTPEQNGQIPAIALTGYASLQDRAHALEAGYQEHLAKPVDLEILIELIKSLLGSKAATK